MFNYQIWCQLNQTVFPTQRSSPSVLEKIPHDLGMFGYLHSPTGRTVNYCQSAKLGPRVSRRLAMQGRRGPRIGSAWWVEMFGRNFRLGNQNQKDSVIIEI